MKALVLAALLVVGCSATAVPRTDVTRTGQGDGDSARFYAAGDYNVAWALRGAGCIAAFYLYGPGTPRAIAAFAQTDGTSRVNALPPSDQWFLRAASSCPWSVVMTPA